MSILVTISLLAAKAQSPSPIIVPAATLPATGPQPAGISTPAAQDSASLQAVLKSLQEIKAANDETLKKQEAAIQQLDELQAAAEQMKIFSKRG